MYRSLPFAAFALFTALAASAANFSVSPTLVSNDYSGALTFQMSGLTAGETVQIVQFYDFNANGVVDGPDRGVRSDLVTDGQAAVIGGATNRNVLGDEDGSADGAIHSSLRFSLTPELARGVGHYVFVFSSPSNHFGTVTVPFTVASASYGQQVQGAVQCNGTNVPHAGVALVQVVAGRIKPVIGGAADAAGRYSLPAPADTYYLIAFWPGYVMDFKTAPHFALAANASVTTNLNLTAATTALSGQLVDNDNPGTLALPYSQITLFTADHLFALSVTDSNANFNVPVTPGSWTVRPRWQNAAARAYLVPEPGSFMEPSFDTSGGALTGANVALKRATALIYGSVEDNFSNSIGGINLSANVDGGSFDSVGLSDVDGSYALATDAGGGFVNVQELSSPPANGYLWSGDYVGINDGQAVNLDVIGHRPTAHFRGNMLDDLGLPLRQFSIFANNNSGGTSLSSTDTNGWFDLPVFGGNWQLYADAGEAEQRGVIFPPYSFQVTDGVDTTNTIVVRRATGQISGLVQDLTNGVISGLSITLAATVDSTSYNLSAYTDYNGTYASPVFNGTWTVSLSPYDLLSRGYNPANPIPVTVPPTNGLANFTLVPIGAADGPAQITTTSLPGATVGQSYSQVLNVTNAAQSFSWSLLSGSLPDGLSLDSYLGTISGTPSQTGPASFTVQLTDARGSNAVAVLSLDVRATTPPAPKLDQPVLFQPNRFQVRVTGAAGQSYTLQMATDPGHWTDLLTTNAPANVFYLQDTSATNASRLYRLRVNP